MYDGVICLFSRNWHNIVSQLYFNLKILKKEMVRSHPLLLVYMQNRFYCSQPESKIGSGCVYQLVSHLEMAIKQVGSNAWEWYSQLNLKVAHSIGKALEALQDGNVVMAPAGANCSGCP